MKSILAAVSTCHKHGPEGRYAGCMPLPPCPASRYSQHQKDKKSGIHIVDKVVGLAHLPDIIYRCDKSKDQHNRNENIDVKFPEPFEESDIEDDDKQLGEYMAYFSIRLCDRGMD